MRLNHDARSILPLRRQQEVEHENCLLLGVVRTSQLLLFVKVELQAALLVVDLENLRLALNLFDLLLHALASQLTFLLPVSLVLTLNAFHSHAVHAKRRLQIFKIEFIRNF